MRQDNEQAVAARRCCLAVCKGLATAVALAVLVAGGTANAQRFQGGAGSPDPGMGGTTGSPGLNNTGPLGGGAAAGAGVGAAAGAGGMGQGASTVPGAGPSFSTSPSTGGSTLVPLPPANVSGGTPLGSGSPVVGSGSSSLGNVPSGSTPLGGTLGPSGSSGSSGFGSGSSGLGGTPLRNDNPILGGSQPPSNPACGTLTASTSCATGR
jgi:hypothetical protein